MNNSDKQRVDLADLEAEADKTELVFDSTKARSISELANVCVNLTLRIDDLERQIATSKGHLRRVTETLLPNALHEVGMKQFTLKSGASVTLKPFYAATIKSENTDEALQWLRDHGFADLIKNQLAVQLSAGQDNTAACLKAELGVLGLAYTTKEAVHASTLKAWVKECYETGVAIPAELFGVHVGTKAIVSAPTN